MSCVVEREQRGRRHPLSVTGSVFRVVSMCETGDWIEDGGAPAPLDEARALALQPRRVSVLYINLRDRAEASRPRARVERRFPDLFLCTASAFADQKQFLAFLDTMEMGVAGMAVVTGGIDMTNTLFTSVFERTHEIGVLRSLGWSRARLLMRGEWLTISLLSGLLDVGLGVLATLSPAEPTRPGGPAVFCHWRHCATTVAAGRVLPAPCLAG